MMINGGVICVRLLAKSINGVLAGSFVEWFLIEISEKALRAARYISGVCQSTCVCVCVRACVRACVRDQDRVHPYPRVR